MRTADCTERCWTMPECTVCHRPKQPTGRSAPLEAANGYCDFECEGYKLEPFPGHLWPSESPRSEFLAALPDVIDGLREVSTCN